MDAIITGRQSPVFRVKDPISTLTHFIGFCASLAGMPVLLSWAAYKNMGLGAMLSFSVFMLSMICLYGASSAYHAFHISPKVDRILKKNDHMMIFVLIAGSYTPVCALVLGKTPGTGMLVLMWSLAAAGMLFKALWVTCPKWVSSVIYIAMGWAAILVIKPLYLTLSPAGFAWLLSGGICYTAGGVIYSLKFRRLAQICPGFGEHEIFHIFVMLGSLCHYIMMFTL